MKKNSFIHRVIIAFSLIFIMTGCHHSRVNAPIATEQVEQLASLIAGGSYLRQQCAQTTLPDEQALTARALGLAEKRGWNTRAAEYKSLYLISMKKQQLIDEDPRLTEEKCRKLADSLLPFISGQ